MAESEWFKLEGLGDRHPLLIEDPVGFERRMQVASGYVADGWGEPVDRLVSSPVLTVPFWVPQAEDRVSSEALLAYPLLNLPKGVVLPEDADLSTVGLALRAWWTLQGCLATQDGDLYYTTPIQEDADASDWLAVWDWATLAAPLLVDVNVARLMLYATDWNHRVDEAQTAAMRRLYRAWGVPEDADYGLLVSDRGMSAIRRLEDLYGRVFDEPYQPLARF